MQDQFMVLLTESDRPSLFAERANASKIELNVK